MKEWIKVNKKFTLELNKKCVNIKPEQKVFLKIILYLFLKKQFIF